MNKLKIVLIGSLGLVVVLVLAKNVVANMAVTGAVKAITGLQLKIRRMDVGLTATRIGVEGLEVLNPAGFHDTVMVDLPEIYVDYDLGAFLSGRTHLKEVRLRLRELTIIKNERGQVNLHALHAIQASQQKAQTQAGAARPVAPPRPLHIDVLELQIGKVVYKDYSTASPHVREFTVNVHERFRNVTNPHAIAALIVTRALAKTTIAQLVDLDLGALQAELADVLRGSVDHVIGGVGQGALDTAGQAVTETTGALKKLLGQ